MGEFSISHLLVLAVIFLIFFGPSRLPQLGQSLGKAIRGFKQGISEIEVEAKDIKDQANSTTPQNQTSQQLNQQNQTGSSQAQSEGHQKDSVGGEKSDPSRRG